MGKSLSLNIREGSVGGRGLSCHEAARRSTSAASAVRIMQRKKRTGGSRPHGQGRPRRSKLDAVSDWLKQQVEAQPDMTMPELAEALCTEHDLGATPAMLSRHLIHRLGFTYKQNADCGGEAAQAGFAPHDTSGAIGGCRECALSHTGWCLSTNPPSPPR